MRRGELSRIHFSDFKSNLERMFCPLPPDCGPVCGEDETQRTGLLLEEPRREATPPPS